MHPESIQNVMKDPNDYLTNIEITNFFKVIDNLRDRMLFFTLLRTGRRIAEVVKKCDLCGKTHQKQVHGIKPININFEDDRITWYIMKKKKAQIVQLPTHKSVIESLQQYVSVESIPPNKHIFPITTRRVNQIIEKKGMEVGIPRKKLHAHVFRHTFALKCYKITKDIFLVKKMLQHSHIGMSLHYADVLKEDVEIGLKEMWD